MRGLAPLILSLAIFAGSSWAREEIAEEHVQRSLEEAAQWVKEFELEAFTNGTGFSRPRGTRCTPESEEMGRGHQIYERALEILHERHNVSKHIGHRVLRQTQTGFCLQPAMSCVNSKYRSIDGSCNNLNFPWWGMAGTAQTRLLRPVYADGRDAPRGGINSILPSARLVSNRVHPDANVEYPGITNMVPQFGQFLDHDITLTPEANRQCCRQGGPDCWNIPIPPTDNFYSRFGETCLDFTRSTPCINRDNGFREQTNANTAFIDGSQIYGSTADRARRLRGPRGQLLVNNQGSASLKIPLVGQTGTQTQGAFAAGDDRINEMPGLAAMHNLFLKEHNGIAAYIASQRPGWTDEQIFQETRRIVSAELQVITYKEYLPIVLGPATMQKYGLTLTPGQYSSYQPNVNPTIINSFSTAAYRFGHTLVSNFIRMIHSLTRNVVQVYQIKDQYSQPNTLTLDGGRGSDYILTSLLETQAQRYDPFVADGMTNFLFAQPGGNFGGDLVARNIQRGRDHGLPSFNDYRLFCGLPSVDSQPADIPGDAWSRLMETYRGNPRNIDLFSGGLTELPANGGISGATFQCIKGIQFQRLKYGDRYFVTHSNQVGSFTPAQLQALTSRRLSDVICNAGNGVHPYAQANAFLIPSATNPRIDCNDPSRRLNLDLFI